MGDCRWDNTGNCVPAKRGCREGRTCQGIKGMQQRRTGLLTGNKVLRGMSWQRDVSGHGRFPREHSNPMEGTGEK